MTVRLKESCTPFFFFERKTDEALSHRVKIIKGVCFSTRENSSKMWRRRSSKIPLSAQRLTRCLSQHLFDPGSHRGWWWISNARVNTAPPLRRLLGSLCSSSHARGRRQMVLWIHAAAEIDGSSCKGDRLHPFHKAEQVAQVDGGVWRSADDIVSIIPAGSSGDTHYLSICSASIENFSLQSRGAEGTPL